MTSDSRNPKRAKSKDPQRRNYQDQVCGREVIMSNKRKVIRDEEKN